MAPQCRRLACRKHKPGSENRVDFGSWLGPIATSPVLSCLGGFSSCVVRFSACARWVELFKQKGYQSLGLHGIRFSAVLGGGLGVQAQVEGVGVQAQIEFIFITVLPG